MFLSKGDMVDSPAELSLCTNACSMGNKQEELEITVQLESYHLITAAEARWDELNNRSTAGRLPSVYKKECKELSLKKSDEQVESL